MKALALSNLKGGVGKTTAAVHLAHLSARAGRATLLWDLDPQGAASWICRVRVDERARPKHWLRDRVALWGAIRGSDWPGLDVLPADHSLTKLASSLQREGEPESGLASALADLGTRYERIVLDLPPALSPITECAFDAVDAVVVPTIPTPLSLRMLAALHRLLKPLRRRGLLVLPFFSMADSRKAIHRSVREFARAQDLGFLMAEIPHSVQFENSATRREPLTVSGTHPAAAFEALHDEVEDRMAASASQPKLRRARLMEFVQEMGSRRRPLPSFRAQDPGNGRASHARSGSERGT